MGSGLFGRQEFANSLTCLQGLLQKDLVCRSLADEPSTLKTWKTRDLDTALLSVCDGILDVVSRLEKVSTKMRKLHSVHMQGA